MSIDTGVLILKRLHVCGVQSVHCALSVAQQSELLEGLRTGVVRLRLIACAYGLREFDGFLAFLRVIELLECRDEFEDEGCFDLRGYRMAVEVEDIGEKLHAIAHIVNSRMSRLLTRDAYEVEDMR